MRHTGACANAVLLTFVIVSVIANKECLEVITNSIYHKLYMILYFIIVSIAWIQGTRFNKNCPLNGDKSFQESN